jgi:YidC/Oxa1 family membrane protein insertase
VLIVGPVSTKILRCYYGVSVNDSSNDSEYNKRAMRAIVLCVLVAIVYTQAFLAPKRRAELEQKNQASVATTAIVPQGGIGGDVSQQAQPATVVGAGNPIASGQTLARLTPKELEEAPRSQVKFGGATVSIVHLGGRIAEYRLRDYKRDLKGDEQLDLVDSASSGVLPLGLYLGSGGAGIENDERVLYKLEAVNGELVTAQVADLDLRSGAKASLRFKGVLPSGVQVQKTLNFSADSFLFTVDVSLDRALPAGQSVWLEWSRYYSSELERALRVKHSITLLDSANKIRSLQIEGIPQGLQEQGSNRWLALGDTYFAMALVPTVANQNSAVGREGDLFFSRVAGTGVGGQFYAYVGPKDYRTLESLGNFSLERSIDLGWFAFLALPLLWLLRFLSNLFGNYGVAIIGLTLLVKGVMLPLSKASFNSAKKMQDLQPEIKALRERVKDPNVLNQEMFALYKRKGVNPMGGCFPVLIQIPVFLGLYNALLNAIELRHARFAGWITDLSAPESLQLFGIGVPVMVLLMAASMVYQSWTTPNPSADPNQQKMMMIMPVVFAGMFIIFPMPAGLVLYWLVNNIISIIQQLYMRSSEKGSVYVGTAVASALIFGVGYILTMI